MRIASPARVTGGTHQQGFPELLLGKGFGVPSKEKARSPVCSPPAPPTPPSENWGTTALLQHSVQTGVLWNQPALQMGPGGERHHPALETGCMKVALEVLLHPPSP